MGNTASLAEEEDGPPRSPSATAHQQYSLKSPTTVEARQAAHPPPSDGAAAKMNDNNDDEVETAGTAKFNVGDSFSLSKEGGGGNTKSFPNKHDNNNRSTGDGNTKDSGDDSEDTDEHGTYTDEHDDTGGGTSITDDDEGDTMTTNKQSSHTFTDGEGEDTDERSLANTQHTNNTQNTAIITDESITDKDGATVPKLSADKFDQEHISLSTEMAHDGDDEATIEEKRRRRTLISPRNNKQMNRGLLSRSNNNKQDSTSTTSGSCDNDDDEESSIQILDAEEEFSHILQYTTPSSLDLDDDLMLLKAQHQHAQAKKLGYYRNSGNNKRRQQQRPKQEPPATICSSSGSSTNLSATTPLDKYHRMVMLPIVEGVDTDTEEQDLVIVESQNPSMLTMSTIGDQQRTIKYPILGMSEIQNVVALSGVLSRTRQGPRSHYDDRSMMIVVDSSDVVDKPTAKKHFFTTAGKTSDQDSVHHIPFKNMLRESGDDGRVPVPGSVVSLSVASAGAIATTETHESLDENDVFRDETPGEKNYEEEDDDDQEQESPPKMNRSPRLRLALPTSPLPMSPAAALLRAHDEEGPIADPAATTINAKTNLPEIHLTHDVDMSIVKRFVQTFNSFLRNHRQFDSLDPSVIDALRVLKLQKLLTTLSEVESELEEFIASTIAQKQQNSLDYHAKLVECNKKKASRKIELLRTFEELRHTSCDLEKNLRWELILVFEARAKREYDLKQSLSQLTMDANSPLSLLPDAQAPAIQRVLWTDEFRLDDVKQLQIENAFLRAEAAVLEKKLKSLVTNAKHDSCWVDAVFRKIDNDQLAQLRDRHEARFATLNQHL